MIDSCGNACGLIGAFVGVIGFGTFGAPLKSDVVNRINPDPFVLQTYKSTMCYLTSFIVLALGEEYHFSPWGLLSGVLWVTGGICGIFGIRNSGLAISVGTWSAFTILISFTWGIFMFGEKVISISETMLGLWCMIAGFSGMAYFSSPGMMEEYEDDIQWRLQRDQRLQREEDDRERRRNRMQVEEVVASDTREDNRNALKEPLLDEYMRDEEKQVQSHNELTEEESGSSSPVTVDESESPDSDGGDDEFLNGSGHEISQVDDTKVLFLGFKVDRWALGIVGAAMDGLLGGGNLIPMHYSPYQGSEFLISFATGAMIITILFWVIRLCYNAYELKSVKKGWDALPSMHLRKLLIPGAFAGTLWSLGNIGQIMSVYYLGESIGMSIVQSSMIVSGFLGIVWFKEIKGARIITLWSLSAIGTFIGIIFLSRQHKTS